MAQQIPAPWWDAYSNIIPHGYRSFIAAESQATEMQLFSALVVPGILQTQRYGEECIGTTPFRLSSEIMEQLLEVRMKRQWHTLEQSNPPKIDVVLEEPVLYRQLGGPQILKEQLRHLLALNKQSNITIRILPLEAMTVLSWQMAIYTLFVNKIPHNSSIFFEDYMGAMIEDNTSAVTNYYSLLFSQLLLKALDKTSSDALIKTAIKWLDTTVAAHD